MPKVKFLKDGKEIKEIEVHQGANLRRSALEAGVAVHHDIDPVTTFISQYANCHGLGMCGTCHVFIKKGMENCSRIAINEKARLWLGFFSIGHEKEVRLSCQTKVMGDIEVEVQPKGNTTGERFWEMKAAPHGRKEEAKTAD